MQSVKYFAFAAIAFFPAAETVADIVKALNEINPAAAEKFVELYPGELIKNEDEPQS